MRNFWILLLLCGSLGAQEKYTISGYIRDANSKEVLIGSTVYLSELQNGSASNTYGFYSVTAPEGKYKVLFSYLGYEPQLKEIVLNQDIDLNILLTEQSTEIGEIVVTDSRAKARENVERAQVGIIDLPAKQIKELPAIGGEKDILKALVLLPGVQSGSEGTAGFYVRGGGPDQNLILLDEAVVYNPYHLFGFLSVFNVDAIKNVSLIKGGYPAKYGGRLSSILNINMKDGDMENFHGEGGIGTVFSRLTLEGPIIKNKASFLVSGRRTYFDKLVRGLSPKEFKDDIPTMFFYDLNAKLNYKLSDKDRFYLSGYLGEDRFGVEIPEDSVSFAVPWGNRTATARWNHVFGKKLFSNTSLIYNKYNFNFEFESSEAAFASKIDIETGIEDYTGKIDFDYYPNLDHSVKFGAQYTRHQFTPSISQIFIESEIVDSTFVVNDDVIDVDEGAFYVSDEWTVNPTLSIQAGLRAPFFISDSINYFNLEPRLIAKFSLGKDASVKAAYSVMNQYVHLITNSGVSFPWDIWIPSSKKIGAKRAQQVSLGVFKNIFDDQYETSIEAYYKKMDNLIEYKEGANILSEDRIEDQVTFGEGWAYGAEFFIRKRTGRLNGWLGYTLSWSDRKFEELNGGRIFPAKYDRRHDLSLVAFYDFNEHWAFSGVFVYGSGHSLTMPEGSFGNGLLDYTGRNGFKLRSYNRMDLGLRYTSKPDAKFQSIIRFDIYNVYSRRNPYFVYLDTTRDPYSDGRRGTAKQVSLLPMIPAVSWNFKF